LVGVLHAALFLLSWWLLQDAPGTDATNAEVADYYASESSRRFLLVGLYVMPFAGIAFVGSSSPCGCGRKAARTGGASSSPTSS
jgi:hypothetical protein